MYIYSQHPVLTDAGGIYSLLMIAGQDMRYVIAKMMKGNMPRDLANLLRAPDSGMLLSSFEYLYVLSHLTSCITS